MSQAVEAKTKSPVSGSYSMKTAAKEEGIKHDSGKPRYDLIPPEALDGLARLYGMGAATYGDRNWEKGMAWGRLFAALMRHAWKWFRGETYDGQDGQHHLLSVMWCAVSLYTYEHRSLGSDDRPRGGDPRPGFWRREQAVTTTATEEENAEDARR